MKAIMIVDIPDNCNKSLLAKTPASITFNHGTYKTLLYVEGYLKPMPQKRNEDEVPTMTVINGKAVNEYDLGWNDCLDEILGETND